MIPLRLKAMMREKSDPYVIRLRGSVERDLGSADASLIEADAESAIYRTARGNVTLSGARHEDMNGDVIAVYPQRNFAQRLIRASSPHNTLLITERCDQLCQMCSQPPKEYHEDQFPLFQEALMLAPQGITIGLSGGEPTLFKDQLFELLQFAAENRPDLKFHILSNGQHFESHDLAVLRKLPGAQIVWGIPIYSAIAGRHDDIVGKPGAFSKLMSNLAILARSGHGLEIRTVVMNTNIEDLPALAKFLTIHVPFADWWAIMQLEHFGFGKANWDKLFFDNSADFSNLAQALDTAKAKNLPAKLYNFPLCTVPEPFRTQAPATISDWKQKYLEECQGCELKGICSGFFEWYPATKGFRHLGLQ